MVERRSSDLKKKKKEKKRQNEKERLSFLRRVAKASPEQIVGCGLPASMKIVLPLHPEIGNTYGLWRGLFLPHASYEETGFPSGDGCILIPTLCCLSFIQPDTHISSHLDIESPEIQPKRNISPRLRNRSSLSTRQESIATE